MAGEAGLPDGDHDHRAHDVCTGEDIGHDDRYVLDNHDINDAKITRAWVVEYPG